jgi:Tfp pilus assembly protein PilF
MTAAVQKGTKDPGVYYHLGLVYIKTGDQSKAREVFRKALNLDPNFEKAAEIQAILK